MSSTASAVLDSWSVSPWFALLLLSAALVYARGWRDLHAQMPERFPRWRIVAFVAGLAVLFAAIASPLDAFAFLSFPAHMVQHVLLSVGAPPLLLLGAPSLALLRGLPPGLAKSWLGPFLAWPALRGFGARLAHPLVGGGAMAIAFWGWHVPAAYELALRVPAWHGVEHASFLVAGLLFWWPVVQPWPSQSRVSRWAIVPYLLLADLQNTALAALLVFSDRVLYPSYANAPRLGSLSALDGQALAGVLMWVPMSIALMLPAGMITLRLLSPQRVLPAPAREAPPRPATRRRARFDLLATPWLGALLRSQRARRIAQGCSFVAAIAVVFDGFFGNDVAPMNLAGVVPWTYWRGAVVAGLLLAGNVFCPICPFMLTRDLARRVHTPRRPFPRALRSKWLPLALILASLVATERFSLWDSPAWTASIVLAYFAGALVVDSLFAGASFCKYVCPIGNFQFVNSLASPLQVAVRRPETCATCATHDCVRGNERARGCELELFAPRKSGGLDCTFCLDCVRACPHDNIGLFAGAPGRDLLRDPDRSSLGRLSRRLDVAALALLVVFGAFASGAAMTGRVSTAEFAGALTFAPLGLALLAGASGRRLAKLAVPLRAVICRFSLALVPLGLAMWAAHLLLHLIAGWRSIVPVVQRWAPSLLGSPDWSLCLPGIASDRLLGFEVLVLDAGLLVTLWVAWRVAESVTRRAAPAFALAAPFLVLAVALWLFGVWSFLQPMQMRGLLSGG